MNGDNIKWKEFLDSMNIRYTEDRDSYGRKSIEIDSDNIISGPLAYIMIRFYSHDDGFNGFESNDS